MECHDVIIQITIFLYFPNSLYLCIAPIAFFFITVFVVSYNVAMSTLTRAEVKNAWSYTSTPQYAFMA